MRSRSNLFGAAAWAWRKTPLQRRRRGTTLIELLVAITVSSMVLGLVGVFLFSLFLANRAVQDHAAHARSIVRLAMQFRGDAHGAVSAERVADGRLVLNLPDGQSVGYDLSDGRIVRIARRGDEVIHQESYKVPRGTAVRWEVVTGSEPPVARLEMTRPESSAPAAQAGGPVVRIEAIVGRDRRFLKTTEP